MSACVCVRAYMCLIQRSPHPPPTRRPRRRHLSAQERPRGRHVHAKGMGRSRDPKVPAGFRRAGGCVRQVRPVESEHLKRDVWMGKLYLLYSYYADSSLAFGVGEGLQKGGGSWSVVWEKSIVYGVGSPELMRVGPSAVASGYRMYIQKQLDPPIILHTAARKSTPMHRTKCLYLTVAS